MYKTIESPAEGIFKDRGSKFIAYAHAVESIDEIESILKEIDAIHPKARHLCYAYSLGLDENNYRINDDGEPSGTAGRPIFNEIRSADLSDVFIGVIRYFGGTKLGVPGLINAYKTSANEALNNATIVTKYLTGTITINYPHKALGTLYDIIKRLGITEIVNSYEGTPKLVIKQRLSLLGSTRKQILAQYHGYGINDITADFKSPDLTIQITSE